MLDCSCRSIFSNSLMHQRKVFNANDWMQGPVLHSHISVLPLRRSKCRFSLLPYITLSSHELQVIVFRYFQCVPEGCFGGLCIPLVLNLVKRGSFLSSGSFLFSSRNVGPRASPTISEDHAPVACMHASGRVFLYALHCIAYPIVADDFCTDFNRICQLDLSALTMTHRFFQACPV